MSDIVRIEMENGDVIRAELYPDVAPKTVDNFIKLVNEGFFDGTIFHRVIPGFMIQGGEGINGKVADTIVGEFSENGIENNLIHERGVLSMARTMVKDSASSQFFIMHEKAPHLDGSYAGFGRVIEGIEAVDTIVNAERNFNDKPLQDQRMKKVTME